MDTPERNHNQINNPIVAFEDSPVFNYINNLSPIKPVKSVHITQTFNSFTFSSPPSVFTSPHVSSLKESRFLRRHNPLGTSKPQGSSEDVNKVYSREEAHADSTHAHHNLNKLQESADQRISGGDAAIQLSSEHTKFSVELPQTLQYNCGSPSYDAPLCGNEANSLLELPREAGSNVAYVQEGCKTDSIEPHMHLQGTCQIDPKGEGLDCVWDGLIPNATDLLMFNSPNEAEAFKDLMQKPSGSCIHLSDFMSLLPQSTINNGQKIHMVDSGASGSGHEIADQCSEPLSATGTDHRQDNLATVSLMNSNPNEKMDEKLVSVTHRGIRRRCLDFEMANVQSKNSSDNSNTGSSASQSEVTNDANEKQLLPKKRNANSQRCILPGIGLHLNALATLKDDKGTQNEKLSSGRKLSLPNSTSLQISTSQEHLRLSVVSVSSERELDPSDNGVQPAEDCSQASAGEDFNHNSPKKKRRKLEPVGETEGCKRCNCKKSKCLKLYCECFAAGVYCIEPCSCQDCFNKPIHEDTVLQTRKQIESRNPLAFAPKVIRSSDSVPEIVDDPNKTPASARHKRGCNCKKSSCLKKYCECYQGGVGCSISCRCEGCKNAYGRKDGSAEAEAEEDTETSDKGVVEKAMQKTEIQNIEDHLDSAVVSTPLDSAMVSTPLRLSRPLLPIPFSSKGKPPRSFMATISGSALYTGQKLGKPNSLWSQAKNFQTVQDDEMPDILRDDGSPIACIKTSSPNGKRISSPKCDMGLSPNRRGGRKLILQSIPSFPSLTPHP